MSRRSILIALTALVVLAGSYYVLDRYKGQEPREEVPRTETEGATETVTVKVGEKRAVLGETLEVLRVIEDSRCPADVQCIQAGTLRLEVRMQTGMGESRLPLQLGQTSTTEIQSYTLTDVSPASRAGETIPSEAYEFTIHVERR